MEDDEYPDWLWTLLDETRAGASGEKVDFAGISISRPPTNISAFDYISMMALTISIQKAMTKVQRLRYEKKQEKLLKDLPKEIPVHEQSKDITGPDDDAVTSLQRRQEITKSARAARRKGIRESNFLKSM